MLIKFVADVVSMVDSHLHNHLFTSDRNYRHWSVVRSSRHAAVENDIRYTYFQIKDNTEKETSSPLMNSILQKSTWTRVRRQMSSACPCLISATSIVILELCLVFVQLYIKIVYL
ncbi:hypothetical protein Y032_0010g1164 [Ancylostoma ceylanicum]|uniref:Uncharacterized protein n=1 Tax=Ancylostoma ceylanicum TaxID=53326 RepID=A0A016VI58_9BILA|nr:hypothetical protein Y032_0010g1164 [Ancylostoma ceylanicum]